MKSNHASWKPEGLNANNKFAPGEITPLQLILIGVSGSGKSTIGKLVADALGWDFYDADDFHPQNNVVKMASGYALTDEDRLPWLQSLQTHLLRQIAAGKSSVLACSALKIGYRMKLDFPEVRFAYLHGSKELIAQRLSERAGHYMPPSLLESQFQDLEEPLPEEEAVWVDIRKSPITMMKEIVGYMKNLTKQNKFEEFNMQFSLGEEQSPYDRVLEKIKNDQIIDRIFKKDHTVWRDSPDEIENRLGWLDIADRYLAELPRLEAFASKVRGAGYSHVLLLGMGGSSLAPEVLSKIFGSGPDDLDLAILDSTDPDAINKFSLELDLSRTLFIVATKSGGTVETLSFFKYFYNLVSSFPGVETAGEQFVAITDPGSKLITIAEKYEFRETFINDPNIGGRYSALSMFGLVPAALLGLDIPRFLGAAVQTAQAERSPEGTAARLGVAMGTLAMAGKDKLTLITSPGLAGFGDWVEQLVAESTGKEGKGILPVVGEPSAPLEEYGNDRFFVGLVLGNDHALVARLDELSQAGHPVVRANIDDVYMLSGLFYTWELATAVAGHVLDIQPFDQPNVESAKVLATSMVAAYFEDGELPAGQAVDASDENLRQFLADMQPGEYVAIHAYIAATRESDEALTKLQSAIRAFTGKAVTIGYGPRFLHSTGQLHKGDAGNARFIQFVSQASVDLQIPDEAGSSGSQMSFQVLKRSQALGDGQALREAVPPRAFVQFDTGSDAASVISALADGLLA